MRHTTTPSIAKKTATAAAVSYHVNWYGGGGNGGGKDKANCGGVRFGLAVVEDLLLAG